MAKEPTRMGSHYVAVCFGSRGPRSLTSAGTFAASRGLRYQPSLLVGKHKGRPFPKWKGEYLATALGQRLGLSTKAQLTPYWMAHRNGLPWTTSCFTKIGKCLTDEVALNRILRFYDGTWKVQGDKDRRKLIRALERVPEAMECILSRGRAP